MVVQSFFDLVVVFTELLFYFAIIAAPAVELYAHFGGSILDDIDGGDIFVKSGLYFLLLSFVGALIWLIFPVYYEGNYLLDALFTGILLVLFGFGEAAILGFLDINTESGSGDGKSSTIDTPSSTKQTVNGTSGTSSNSRFGSQSQAGESGNSDSRSKKSGNPSARTSGKSTGSKSASGSSNNGDAGGDTSPTDTSVYDSSSSDSGGTEVFEDNARDRGNSSESSTICQNCSRGLPEHNNFQFCPDCGAKI